MSLDVRRLNLIFHVHAEVWLYIHFDKQEYDRFVLWRDIFPKEALDDMELRQQIVVKRAGLLPFRFLALAAIILMATYYTSHSNTS